MSAPRDKLSETFGVKVTPRTAERLQAVADKLRWKDGQVIRHLIELGLDELEVRAEAAGEALVAPRGGP